MSFIRNHYGRTYAPNTRETFRRQVLHQFVQSKLVDYNPDDPSLPTNSPKTHYAISLPALQAVQRYGTAAWESAVRDFRAIQGSSLTLHQARRVVQNVAIKLPNGTLITLSPGEHNRLQAEVIKQFVPRFAPDCVLLYLGDTADKDLYVATDQLISIGVPITEHDKLPDIILYDPVKHWLFLIEVVTSHGPMTAKRVLELDSMLRNCRAGRILVSAFPTFAFFRKYLKYIAWETEVWLAEAPEHLIHFNGDRLLGPR